MAHLNIWIDDIIRATMAYTANEKFISDYFATLVYAVFDDITRDWEGELLYLPNLYQHYANMIVDKKQQIKKLKPRFTVSSEVKQYLAKFFDKMIGEFRDTIMADDIGAAGIVDHMNAIYEECFTSFMYTTGAKHAPVFGRTLAGTRDSSNWFHAKICGELPTYSARPVTVSLAAAKFDEFLKALAWMIGKLIWYHETTISRRLFLGIIAQLNMAQPMIDDLDSGLRVKESGKKAPRAPVNAAAVIAAEQMIGAALAAAPPVAAAPSPVAAAPSPVAAAPSPVAAAPSPVAAAVAPTVMAAATPTVATIAAAVALTEAQIQETLA